VLGELDVKDRKRSRGARPSAECGMPLKMMEWVDEKLWEFISQTLEKKKCLE
jgi:hypothetical protein